MVKDHLDIAKLFYSIDGCFNKTFERALSNPFIRNIEVVDDRSNRCNICPGCSGTIVKMYNRIDISGAKDILFAAFTSKPKYDIKDIVQFIATHPNIDQCLFNKRRRDVNIPKQAIKLFLFQLIRWGILVPEYNEELKAVIFKASITEGSPTMFKFQINDRWLRDIPPYTLVCNPVDFGSLLILFFGHTISLTDPSGLKIYVGGSAL